MEAQRLRRQPAFEGILFVRWCAWLSDFWWKDGVVDGKFFQLQYAFFREPGIDRPGAWTDHRQRAAKDRQKNSTDSSPAPVKAIHTCTTATSAPTTGVHKPARIKNPRTLPVNSGTSGPVAEGSQEQSYPMVEQDNAQDQSLNEKAEARPAVRERRE